MIPDREQLSLTSRQSSSTPNSRYSFNHDPSWLIGNDQWSSHTEVLLGDRGVLAGCQISGSFQIPRRSKTFRLWVHPWTIFTIIWHEVKRDLLSHIISCNSNARDLHLAPNQGWTTPSQNNSVHLPFYSNLHNLHCMLSRYWSSWIQNNLVHVQPPIFLAVILREIKTGLQLRIQSCNSLQTSMIFIVLQVKSNVSPTSTLPRTKSLPGVRSADRGRAGPGRAGPGRAIASYHAGPAGNFTSLIIRNDQLSDRFRLAPPSWVAAPAAAGCQAARRCPVRSA